MVMPNILDSLTEMYSGKTSLIMTLIFFTAVIVVYATFVFYFYRFMAKRNIIELNLNKFNRYSNPSMAKLLASIFYVLEYLILLPVLTFFWFAILSSLILVLSNELSAATVLIISASLVASVRVAAYVSEDLARDLAKMLPFTLITIAITTPGFFNASALLDRIATIPAMLSGIPYYISFIVGIELTMRVFNLSHSLIPRKGESETEEKNA